MKLRIYLLSTVSSFALAGAVSAADLPLRTKAPAMAMPVANWAGGYFGLHGGVGRLNYSAYFPQETGICGDNPGETCTSSATGAVIGGQIGYNWQSQEWVYGIEADASWVDLSHTQTNTDGDPGSATGKVDWLASFRGRAGLALNRTLVYATGGLALGGVKSSWASCCDGGSYSTNLNKTKVGWVAGFGVEHMFAPQWTGRLEALYYDLGRDTASTTSPPGRVYQSEFTHEIFVLRVGLNYKF